nr:glycosyltransferase family 2 protein [Caldalkalibacillus salinus]
MLLSFRYKPIQTEAPIKKVSVVIPSFNENPEAAVKTVNSVIDQDYPIHEIFFIDDGSKETLAYLQVKKMENIYPNLKAFRYENNKGKREAQIFAFERLTGDMIVTVDSDGYLYPNAVRELLKPFNDPEVIAVTGYINARNRDDNWFTRLLDMRYDNAFRVERAAQSVTGNVLVCSGPSSCYKAEAILENIERYKHQTFLG